MTDISAARRRHIGQPSADARYPDLNGKVAVITGASRGIGAASAAALAANGVTVVLVARGLEALQGVATAIEERGGQAMWVAADCSLAGDVDRMAVTIGERLGGVDIVLAFAGGNGMPVPTWKESPEHWAQVLGSDLTATFLTIRAFLPVMVDRGQGVIVTMSSAAARQPAQSSAAYAAAKAGVIALTRHLAKEMADAGIRINCVAPSAIENDRMRTWMSEAERRTLAASFPLGRLGQPDDVAAATLFLCSQASSWVTGATLDIAGGKIMV